MTPVKCLGLIAIFLCFAVPARAQDNPYSLPDPAGSYTPPPVSYNTATDPDYTDPRVRACQGPSDCVLFVPPCRAPVAVNTQSLPALQNWKTSTAYRFGCNVNKLNYYNTADCINGYCAVTAGQRTRNSAIMNNPKYCERASDCRVAVDPCGRKTAINARHHAFKQADLDREGPCETVTDDRPVMDLRCTFNICDVLLNNYGSLE